MENVMRNLAPLNSTRKDEDGNIESYIALLKALYSAIIVDFY